MEIPDIDTRGRKGTEITGQDLCTLQDVEGYTVFYFLKYKFGYVRGND